MMCKVKLRQIRLDGACSVFEDFFYWLAALLPFFFFVNSRLMTHWRKKTFGGAMNVASGLFKPILTDNFKNKCILLLSESFCKDL